MESNKMSIQRFLMHFFQWSVNRWFYVFCCMGLTSLIWMGYKISNVERSSRPLEAASRLSANNQLTPSSALVDQLKLQRLEKSSVWKLTVENRALLILNPSKKYSTITIAMLHSRLKFYSVQYKKPGIGALTNDLLIGLYSVIVFEDLNIYLLMDSSDREKLEKYCKQYSVGMIYFSQPRNEELHFQSKVYKFPLLRSTNMPIGNYVVSDTPVADIAKPSVIHDVTTFKNWVVFHPNHPTYQTISHGTLVSDSKNILVTSVLDLGRLDGIKRIFFGHQHSVWIHKILFLDALAYLTKKAMKMDKSKFIQIDIDDMFLGKNGTKMHAADVTALVNAQEIWRKHYVPGFNFYIGFSAKFFKRGLNEEREGDEEMIRQASHFQWFDHTFAHIQAHKYTDISDLVKQMELSKQFAKEKGIPITSSYNVAPHHSGVYPTHDQLYEAWKQVWNITVTSTEEYPHLKPPWSLRGFIYRGIKVLPRQVCGLYTKNLNYSEYPGGPSVLEWNIMGGDLFDTVLYNYVNVYMTHQQNYAKDHLSIYTFDKLFRLFNRATTLELQGAPPEEMARLYFTRYPKEVDAVWLNPCEDPRHREIWNEEKHCTKLPSLLVVGPQKTGSTALYTFLKLHPNITANSDSPKTYEELQFFGSDNYKNGIDWYMDFFPTESGVLFEKSATYFDKEVVPRQAHSLLPQAKIIIILLDPIVRAFSWYHHRRAHNDKVAMSYSFYEVITASSAGGQEKRVLDLKTHLLRPGFYYDHIQRWRRFYPDPQIMYVDGEKLKRNPSQVMDAVQDFLEVDVKLDYTQLLRYDKEKGFYCVNSKCLGKGKGRSRQYGEVDKESLAYLQQVFTTPNSYLKRLFKTLGLPRPSWLV